MTLSGGELRDLAGLAAAPVTRWLGHELVLLDETTSTNDEAARRGRDGAHHGLVIVADTQTRGRGRQGHGWYSPPGENLYLSALLRLDCPPRLAPPLTLAAGVAVHDAVASLGVRATLDWPNDVRAGGRKLAGILTETTTRGQTLEFVVLGIGLDVGTTAFPPELQPIATSLALELAPASAPSRAHALAALLVELERWLDRFIAGGAAAIVPAWRERSELVGTRVRVQDGARTVTGIAHDLDEEGALLVHGDDGAHHRIFSGEVTTA